MAPAPPGGDGGTVGASGHVALVRRKRGAQWYARGRINGRPFQRRLGPAWTERGRPPEGWYTERTAREALAAYLTDARRGQLPATRRTGVTFGDACAEWLRYCRDDRRVRTSTLADYRLVADSHLRPEFGDATPIEAISAERIEAWRDRLVAEGRLSDRTVNKLLTNMHGVMRRAQRRYGLAANPCAGVERRPDRRSGDFQHLTPDEVLLLAQHADDVQDAAIYTVAGFTGLRLGELLALRWGDVDFGKRLVHVRRSYTYGAENAPKSGKVRSVPLADPPAAALDALSRRERHTGAGDLVFCSPVGGYIDSWAMRCRYKAALRRAGLPQLRFHDLRHTFGTMAAQCFPLGDVRAYMGHADISTTMIYAHHVPQHAAAEKLTQLVQAAGAPATAAV